MRAWRAGRTVVELDASLGWRALALHVIEVDNDLATLIVVHGILLNYDILGRWLMVLRGIQLTWLLGVLRSCPFGLFLGLFLEGFAYFGLAFVKRRLIEDSRAI